MRGRRGTSVRELQHSSKPLPELAFANSINPPDMFIHRWCVFIFYKLLRKSDSNTGRKAKEFCHSGHSSDFLPGSRILRQCNISQQWQGVKPRFEAMARPAMPPSPPQATPSEQFPRASPRRPAAGRPIGCPGWRLLFSSAPGQRYDRERPIWHGGLPAPGQPFLSMLVN